MQPTTYLAQACAQVLALPDKWSVASSLTSFSMEVSRLVARSCGLHSKLMMRNIASLPHRGRVPDPFAISRLCNNRPFCSFQVTFVKNGGDEFTVLAKSGQTVLEIAHEHSVEIEGACGGECACSTCHIIFDETHFDKLPEPDDDEVDMLDLAAHVCDTSRLGCQVKLMAGRDDDIRITLPTETVNLLA
mmetsp:Transcript_25962/g.41164  ORF Transcript_25962/g.41164 Transcript_25962/m.41164 type:complete len:189 (+) Transcript_25962:1-567(+)